MKKKIRYVLILLVLVVSTLTLQAQEIPKDSLYLGQKPPGINPVIFKLPLPANYFTAERIAISNDDKEIFYQDLDGYSELDGKSHTSRINSFIFKDGKWNGPTKLFDEIGGPCLSNDGSTMYLEKGLKQAFYSIKTEQGWSAPKRFLNNIKITHYFQPTNSGNYYISAYPADNIGGIDRSRLIIKGTDTTITSLGLPVNSNQHDLDYFVSRDESYMILVVNNFLHISYPKKDGGWTNPKNLGEFINFGVAAWGPYVTRDNKYMFFTTGTKLDYSDTRIYWVSIKNKVDDLKQTNYIPYVKNIIPKQSASVGQLYSYTIPANIFIDDDGNNTLTYSAALSNGSPLPIWLSFNSAKNTISGTPSQAGVLNIKITATDKAKEEVSCEFEIVVGN